MYAGHLHNVKEGEEFSLSWVTKSGSIVRAERCVLTSFHSSGDTMNVKFCESGQIRKVNRYTIIEFNGEDFYL